MSTAETSRHSASHCSLEQTVQIASLRKPVPNKEKPLGSDEQTRESTALHGIIWAIGDAVEIDTRKKNVM